MMENLQLVGHGRNYESSVGGKWITLKSMQILLNIKPEEIIAIGDENNDIEMIMNSGLGIAMKNGR